jgi:hypothetical protein
MCVCECVRACVRVCEGVGVWARECVSAAVFELRGGWGVEPPSCLLNPPNKMPWDTLGGGSVSTPPPLLMMLNRLCVMTMTMNRQMLKLSTPHLFFDNSNTGVLYACLQDYVCN